MPGHGAGAGPRSRWAGRGRHPEGRVVEAHQECAGGQRSQRRFHGKRWMQLCSAFPGGDQENEVDIVAPKALICTLRLRTRTGSLSKC